MSEHRDIDSYGKPYVWSITLQDFEVDERERHSITGAARCPLVPIEAYCGHSWTVCRELCRTRKRYQDLVQVKVEA